MIQIELVNEAMRPEDMPGKHLQRLPLRFELQLEDVKLPVAGLGQDPQQRV